MRLYLDLDTRAFIESPQFPRTLQFITLKRRDRIPLDIQFLKGAIVSELAEDAAGRLGLKADKDFNGPFAACDLAWVKSGTGATTGYRFDLNLNTVQIDALFAGVPTPGSVVLMLEIEWTEGDLRTTSNTLIVTLENDIVRGDEGMPAEGTPIYPPPAEIENRSQKGTPNGYAPLDSEGLLPIAHLPPQMIGQIEGLQTALNAKADASSLENLVQHSPAEANFRFKDGRTLQLWNETTSKWHAVFLSGPDGAVQLTFASSGET